MNPEKQKAAARKRVDALYFADDIDAEAHTREMSRIEAGTSQFLNEKKKEGLIARATRGEAEAIVKIIMITVAVLIALSVLMSILSLVLGGGVEVDD